MPIVPYLTTLPSFDNRFETKSTKQETPLCRIFGCKKEDVFLGVSISEIADEFDTPYANEDYETSCVRCYKIFGFKSIAVVRKETYKPKTIMALRSRD